MITAEQAKQIALSHVASQPDPAPGYSFACGRIQAVETGWYFDYVTEFSLDIPTSEQEQFGGAFGFVVDRESGDITLVSHTEWVDLGLAFCDDPYGPVD